MANDDKDDVQVGINANADVNWSPLDMIGSSGLVRFGGWVQEEWLRDLYGKRGIDIYKEMRDNDPIIGAMIFAIKMLIKQADWFVEPAGESAADVEAAEFLEQCMDDMSTSFKDVVQEAMSMIPFGWAFHELVYKRRMGVNQEDGSKRSKYNDGKIGWRKIPLRAQETFWQWIFSEDGSILGMQQVASPDYRLRTIPIEKALLFRLEIFKNNPEGRSILRNAYRPWFFKKTMEEIEGIGIERDLVGLPIATVPPEYLSPYATAEQKAVVNAIKTMVTAARRDEMEGLVFPAAETMDGKKTGFSFQLMSTGARRQFDINATIERYNRQIAMTVLADFILLGHQGTGSFALSSDKTDMFTLGLSAVMDAIADVFNHHAIPRLFQLNDFKGLTDYPKIKHGDIETPDLNELGTYIANLAQSQALTVNDPELEDYLRRCANLPERPKNAPMPAEVAAQNNQANGMGGMDKKPLKPASESTGQNGAGNNVDVGIPPTKEANDGIKKRVRRADPDFNRAQLQRYLNEQFAVNRGKFEDWVRNFDGDDDEFFDSLKSYELVGMHFAPSIGDFLQAAMVGGGTYAVGALHDLGQDQVDLKFGANWGADWVKDKTDNLITGIDEATRNMVYSTISDMVDKGADWQEVADKIGDVYAFSDERAETIARTETGEAYNAGAIQAWGDSGLVQAVKVSDGDYDEICQACDGMIWSLDFAMDHLLEHPRCRREFELVLNSDLPGGEEIDKDQIKEDEDRYLAMGGDSSDSEVSKTFSPYLHPRGPNGQFEETDGGQKEEPKAEPKDVRFDNSPSYGSHGTYRTPMPDDKFKSAALLNMGKSYKIQIAKDALITKVRAFAEGSGGKGKLGELRQRFNLSDQHLGVDGNKIDPETWRKCRGMVEGVGPQGKMDFEVHWFQAPNSEKCNMKVVGVVDKDGKLTRMDNM